MPAKTEPANQLSGLSASIVGTLKERIVGWQYPPEHRLTEESLCREFGVSRSPVREALRVLVSNGFIKKLQNRGYAVRQLDLRYPPIDEEKRELIRLALRNLKTEK